MDIYALNEPGNFKHYNSPAPCQQ